MLDVQLELAEARKTYESRTQSKAWKWLAALSDRIMFYGQVLDILAQHHPEYVSLAWGALKFVFQTIINHQELVKEISKGLALIADLLPRANLSLVLYPTDMMQATLAQLYAHIMRFLQQAILWYRQGKLMHSMSCIIRPWEITYKEQLEAIKDASTRLDKLSDMAAKAELRDTHLQVIEARKDWIDTKLELKILREDNQRLINLMQTGMGRLDQTIISLHDEVRFGFRGQADMLCSVQLNQILSISFPEKLPTSGESLEYCQSIRRRSRHRMRLPLPDISRLARWAIEPASSILLLRGGSSTVSKAFMIDLIDLVRNAKMPIIWALRFANYWESSTTCIDIVKILVLQSLQLRPQALIQGSHPLTVAHLREAASLSDWVCILARVVQGVPRIFIALDSGFLSYVTINDRDQATQLVESLRSELPSSIKIFASAFNLQNAYIADRHMEKECFDICMAGGMRGRGKPWRRKERMSRNRRSGEAYGQGDDRFEPARGFDLSRKSNEIQ